MSRVAEHQLSLVPDIAHARRTDPETSHLAAASVTDLTKTQEKVRACLVVGPACDEQIEMRYRHYFPDDRTTSQSLRSRRSELVAKGEVRFSGEHSTTETGRATRKWELVP